MTDAELRQAVERARAGDLGGVPAILEGLGDTDNDVRLRAAYCCQQIGFSTAIESLSRMAVGDTVSDNRSQAIVALAAIGRPAVVPALIAALNDSEVAGRGNARASLYEVLGEEVLTLLADEDFGENEDPEESAKVGAWWKTASARFDPASVYAIGELAHPSVFVRLLKASRGDLPDGVFVLRGGEPWLVLGPQLRRWTPAGYTDALARPRRGLVVTPPSLVDVLRSGWSGAVPLLHPSARCP